MASGSRRRPRPRRRRRASPRTQRLLFQLALTIGATSFLTILVGLFLLKTVHKFDGDEWKELGAIASAAGMIIPAVLKLWDWKG